MSERTNNDNTTKFLYAFTQSILNIDRSIRWVGITDQDGIIINERYVNLKVAFGEKIGQAVKTM